MMVLRIWRHRVYILYLLLSKSVPYPCTKTSLGNTGNTKRFAEAGSDGKQAKPASLPNDPATMTSRRLKQRGTYSDMRPAAHVSPLRDQQYLIGHRRAHRASPVLGSKFSHPLSCQPRIRFQSHPQKQFQHVEDLAPVARLLTMAACNYY